MPQQRLFEYLRHGQTPFFRLETVDLESGSNAYAGADAIVLGIPYDGGTTYLPGARMAPYHVRRVSALVQSFHPSHRIDVFNKLKVYDGGNAVFPPFNAVAVMESIGAQVALVVNANAVPFIIGGDHSVSVPCLRAVAQRHGPLAVIHVDAHSDTSDPAKWGGQPNHGTPIRQALQDGLIEHGQLYQLGLRGAWGAQEDGDLAISFGARIVTADELVESGIGSCAKQIRDSIGNRPVYITFDVDAVDPAFAPGTGTPVPGGISSREALALIRRLSGLRVVGMDVVEVAPTLDSADLTSLLAASLTYEGLAALAVWRMSQ